MREIVEQIREHGPVWFAYVLTGGLAALTLWQAVELTRDVWRWLS